MVKQWFVVRVPTNMEDRVRESVMNRVKTHNLEHRISQVVVAQVTEFSVQLLATRLRTCQHDVAQSTLPLTCHV